MNNRPDNRTNAEASADATPRRRTPTAGRATHKRGPRSGDEHGARRAILDAAQAQFETRPYAKVTMRGIAREAGVDPALLTYYFGGKRPLFLASMAFPQTPAEVIAELADVPVENLGESMVRTALQAWGDPRYQAAVRGVLQDAFIGDVPYETMGRIALAEVIEPIAARLSGPGARQRAALASSHVFGVVYTRHLAGIEPLVHTDTETLIKVVGGVAQGYLTGDLGAGLASQAPGDGGLGESSPGEGAEGDDGLTPPPSP